MTYREARRGCPDARSLGIEYGSSIKIAGRNEAEDCLSHVATEQKRHAEGYLVSTYSKSRVISHQDHRQRWPG